MKASIKKVISLCLLCLLGLLVLYVDAGRVTLVVWLSLMMIATVLVLGEKDAPLLVHIRRRRLYRRGTGSVRMASARVAKPRGLFAFHIRPRLPSVSTANGTPAASSPPVADCAS